MIVSNVPGGRRQELYHLVEDPGEQYDRTAAEPGRLVELNDIIRQEQEQDGTSTRQSARKPSRRKASSCGRRSQCPGRVRRLPPNESGRSRGWLQPARRTSLLLFCGGAINEAWVWINGQYVGHRPHVLWWRHAGYPKRLELDITSLIVPGQRNTVAIRILNDMEVGGLFGRGFIYAAVQE